MIDSRVRLIYNFKLTDFEKEAFRKGASSFERFNVKIEEAVAGPEAGRGIRSGALISIMAGGEGPFELQQSLFRSFRFSMADTDTRILGVGITPHPMTDGHAPRFAVGKALAGSVVSIADLRTASSPYRGISDDLVLATIETAASHAIGLAMIDFGEKRNCPDSGCLMQWTDGIIDFANRVAAARLDFCFSCQEKIKSTVSSIMYYGMA